MRFKKGIVVVAALFSLVGYAQEKKIKIVLLAGQSNMAGHGNFDAIEENTQKKIKEISSRVLFSTSNNPKIKPVPLTYKQNKVSKKYNFDKHFGPEIFAGLTLAETFPKQQFLFIKKAVGGTSLYGAWNPDWTKEKAMIAERGAARQSMTLFSDHIKNIKNCLAKLKEQNVSYEIIGVLWMQGESDTNTELKATSYKINLENLIAAYRKTLGIANLPFVVGQVNPLPRKFKQGPYLVRTAMEEVAKEDMNVELVETSIDNRWLDFPKHSDNLHYNTEGQKRLGVDFAKALIFLNK